MADLHARGRPPQDRSGSHRPRTLRSEAARVHGCVTAGAFGVGTAPKHGTHLSHHGPRVTQIVDTRSADLSASEIAIARHEGGPLAAYIE